MYGFSVQVQEKKLLIALAAIGVAFLFTRQLPQPWVALLLGIELVSILAAMVWYTREKIGPSIVQAGKPDQSDAFPEQISGCQVLRRIAKTGTSDVYLAEQRTEQRTGEGGRLFAIKVLRDPSEIQLKRLHLEAELSSQLDHPRIVRVREVLVAEPFVGSKMDYVAGEDLGSRVLHSGPLGEAELVEVLIQLCDALEPIHARGLVHRDVKPSNIIWMDDGQLTLLDLGLVLPEGPAADYGETTISGTPAFMAPEAAGSKSLSATSDIYSLGCVAFFLAAGRPPFRSNNPIETLRQQIHEPLDSAPLMESVSLGLAEVILQCLSKSPQDRPRGVERLQNQLRSLAAPRV